MGERMNYRSEKIFKDLDIIDIDEKVSLDLKSTWVMRNRDQKKYILKTKSRRNDLVGKILNLYNNRAFLNELRVYSFLDKNTDRRFLHPKLIKTDNKSLLILEFVDGFKGWEKSKVSNAEMAKSLWYFNNIGGNEIKLKKNNQNWLFIKSMKGLLRLYINKVINLRLLISAGDILYRNNKLQRTLDPVFLHNDLFGPNNILTCTNGEVLFLDFESASFESKWILKDIIELSFDRRKQSFNWGLLKEYREYLYKNYSNLDDVNFPIQIRFVLMFRMIQVLLSKTKAITDKHKEYCKSILLEILLNDEAYENWIQENYFNR